MVKRFEAGEIKRIGKEQQLNRGGNMKVLLQSSGAAPINLLSGDPVLEEWDYPKIKFKQKR